MKKSLKNFFSKFSFCSCISKYKTKNSKKNTKSESKNKISDSNLKNSKLINNISEPKLKNNKSINENKKKKNNLLSCFQIQKHEFDIIELKEVESNEKTSPCLSKKETDNKNENEIIIISSDLETN